MNNNSADITVRSVKKEDVDTLVKYRLEYLTELLGDAPAESKETLRKELTEFFTEAFNQGLIFAYVAEEPGNILGFGVMVLKKIPGDFSQSVYLEGDILNMYTLPFARNRGVSSLILKSLIKEAAERGVNKISLHTTKAGEKVYRKFGFDNPIYPVLELTDLS